MRILYHHRTQAEDGQAVHVRAMIRAFEEEGHEVLEVGLVRHGEDAGERARNGRARWSWVVRLPRFARELAEYAYSGLAKGRLIGAAARFEPDIVYERYAFGNAAGVLAKGRIGVPLVLEVNSPLVAELESTRGLALPGLARRLEQRIWRGADLVCAVSGVLAERLRTAGVAEERLLVTPNGVRLEAYAYADREEAARAARADLGVPPGGPVLGFVGYYRDWHRLDLVIRALSRPELATARLVLVGDGPAGPDLERSAREAGVAERVVLAGRRPHAAIPALLAAFDVALVPAINPYASPLKLHEYMAASLPVVAVDQPNLREVLVDGENALLVPGGDAAALGVALGRLAGDAGLRGRLGAAARRTVVERDLTWRGNARRVVRAVEERVR